MPEPVSIQVGGNVDGSIVVGDNNFVVNTNHGTIVYNHTGPQVRARQFAPQPPRPPRDFVNRATELSQLEAWISANEIVLLYAPDGMGKTSLLKQAANSAAAKAMPNGVILLESLDVAGQLLGPDDVVQYLFDALFESNPHLKVDSVSARTYLSNTRPLVLLDELSLSPALQKLLPDLLPWAAILLTADLPFGSDFELLPVGPLPRLESIHLLATKAGLIPDDAARPGLDAICALLDDVSLALVITANIIRETHTSPAVALQAIQNTVSSEKNPVSAALDRAFSFAFSQLSPDEQKILSAAAFTPGVSMSPEWLALSLAGVSVDAVIERLKALGLLFANSPRLRLPPGFRAPARRMATVDEDAILPRLVEFLTAPLQQDPHNWDYIRDELGNFFGALTWAVRTRRWEAVIALGRVLDPYLTLHGLWDAWDITLGYILDASTQNGQQAVQAWALHQVGTRAIATGTRDQALGYLRRALELRRSLGDTVGMAYTQHNIDLLLAPPPSPRDTGPKSPPSRPTGAGSGLRILLGTLGVLAVLGVLALLIGGGWLFWPVVTPLPYVPPSQTLTPTIEFLTVTPTSALELTFTPTPTPAPTPIGGSGMLVLEAQDRPLLFLDRAFTPCISTLYILNLADRHPQPFSKDLPLGRSPAWSPNGKEIAFIANAGKPLIASPIGSTSVCTGDIYTADPAGTNLLRLTNSNGAGGYSHPAWSPDGTKIAFVGSDSQGGTDIFTMDADGSHMLDLTKSAGQDEDYPEWSPDGSQIAYQAFVGKGIWAVFIMQADGSSPKQLTGLDRQDWNMQPSWSPDGAQIAFISNRTKNWNIYVMNVDGSNLRAVTGNTADNFYPDWSPDGTLIAFASTLDGKVLQLYTIAVDGSGMSLLTTDLPTVDSGEPDWLPLTP